ncbi:hypothetical protein QTP86_029971 [Hemibagrus guttatus]|nr:hypothetical protein QTP86_029971 [Hemibagrus guttatus]
MIAAAFLVLLRPLSLQCLLLLLLLLVGTVATILFLCCWHRRLRHEKIPIKSVFSRRSRSREAGLRTHHFRSEGFRHSPRHGRRSIRARVYEERPVVVDPAESEPDTSSAVRKRKVTKRVEPEFYHSVQVTPTRRPVGSSGSGNASLRCSMSSSADFSDEDDYSVRSGCVSPAPGDTLPWNLPRHERSKRKIHGGSVLDPAERAVLRIADERDRVQKKTFTKWINQHLLKVRKHVNDLYEDLRDGHNLISLLEVLSGDKLPREKGRMRFHRLQNVQIALDYLKKRQVKLVNIRNDDITDGNPKLTLGLIWTIILHFQISDIHVTGESEDMTAKERLLLWSQQMTKGYVGVRCDNFTTSWKDGRLFNALIHKYRPDMVDMSKVSTQSSRTNLEHAFTVAEQLGVARLLDPEDVDVTSPDEKSVITYVSTLYDVFPKVPEGVEGISANDVDVKWVEYQNMVNYLSQWIKHNVTVMSDRNFPCNPVELKALYLQYLHFKESEIPLKENDKTKIKHLYKMLEVWIEFGRIHLPEGYHPNDVEKEWGKLIVAMLEREKSLRPEVDRLEMLQQIADRVKRDCVAGEDKLALARASLQSDIKRLESGIHLQNEPEIAGYLLECENLLRQQVVDIQILLDGKFYLADQLVQRVSKLRDDLLTLRAECSSVYSKGRSLSTEQTKMMISGITQSLNSGFSQNLNMGPALTPGSALSTSFTPTITPGLTPALTPAMTPGCGLTSALISGLQPTLRVGGSMEPGILQHMKHMHIRKPMLKASLVDPSLSEEEVNMKFVQDLLNWVEEMQVQLDQGEWGSDLPSVESHLENHRNVHKAIEDFQMSIKEAQMSEIQMTHPLKQSYSDKLSLLESQYGRLLNATKERQKHLDSLHNFVSHATQELIWLNEKEEEEVAFDWSERNSNISRKKDYHADLMRELDEKEGVIKSVQDQADILLQQNHPARLTIEAYKAAMQTQWSWILQLCYCVEQHLKENVTYFEFFSDAKESMDYLKSLQDSITRKYGCDRTSSLHRLEDLIQESMDEKEQLLQYRSTVAGLITIYKDDECVLANNSHRAKWKVISPSGNEAMVPSVCFTVPPPNKEAAEMASRIEQLYQKVLTLWHRSHVNMKSVVSWHYLMMDIRNIRKSTVASIKTMLPGEHQQVLSSLQSHFEEFLEDSEESEVFTMADCTQLEREVLASKEFYEELLKSAEREEHEESVYNLFISEVRNFRMRVEAHEEQLIRQIRSPLERDDSKAILQRITEQERKKAELDRLSEDLVVLKEKCEAFLRQAADSPSVPTLSSELNVLTQSMAQVYSMCSIYLEKLKTVNLVVKHSHGAEALVKLYEGKLCEEDAVNGDIRSIDAVMSTLKQWRSEIDERRDVFHDLEDELQKARATSDRMFKTHNERDFDLDWHKEKAEQLGERWRNVHAQIENRIRDLEGVSKSLKYYKDAYSSLDEWSKEMEVNQLKTQENQPEDSKALAELLNQQKVLVAEIERKQSKIDECQKYSEQCSAGLKDYELQLMTYRAMVDSQHKSPVKRRRMQSSSDTIQQEFMDLRTRYTALVTLMTQYVKFASETLKRAEEDERKTCMDKAEYRSWLDSMELQKVASDEENSRLKRQAEARQLSLEESLRMLRKNIEDSTVARRKLEDHLRRKDNDVQGLEEHRRSLERELKAKEGAEANLLNQEIVQKSTISISAPEAEALQFKVDELTMGKMKAETEIKTLKSELNSMLMQKNMADEKAQRFKELLDDANNRLMKLQKTQTSHELQLKLRDYNEEAELTTISVEKNLANQKVQEHKVEINNLNMALQKAKNEAQKESSEAKKNIAKLRELENELARCKQTISRMTGTSEKATVNLKLDISTLQREKQAADQKLQALKTEFDDLNSTLKKTKDELLRVTQEGKMNQSKIRELETELQKNRLVIREINTNSDKHTANLQQECSSILKEKGIAEEKITALTAEISQLKMKLDHTQEDLMQKQKETSAAKLRSQMLEDQLENCKRMLEDLKGKLELQKKGYETQLQLVQNEMEQKLALQESRMKLECDRKSKEHLHSAETIERDKKQLLQEIEKLKTLHLNAVKAKQEAQKQLDSMSSQLEQSKKQKGALDLELLKAKSKINELETEKIRVKSSISQLDNIRKENSEETARLKQILTETKQKLMMAENEAKSSKDQIASYIKEVKSLQEKNLKLEVTYNSEMKRLKELEGVNQVNHQCAKDGELAKLKTELMLTQKIVSSYEEAKRNLEEELQKMKLTSEIATLKKDKNQHSTVSSTSQSNLTEHTFTSLKGSLSDKGKPGKNQSVTFNIITTEFDDSASEPSKPSESSLSKVQGLRGRVSIKKLIKTKIITEEIALKLKSGLITMEEVQASLAQFIGKPVSIAGIYIESGKKKISFMDAAEAGIMAKTYAIEFLEAQAATGAIIDPITGESYSASEAIDKGIIGGEFRERLTDAEKAVSGYPHGGKLLSVFQAMEERILDRHRGKAVLEAQIATGGLIHPLIGMRIPPDCAIEQGLINQATLQTLFDPITNPKSFHNPETGQRAYYSELLKLCVYDVNGGVYLLPYGNDHISSFTPASTHRVSVINSSTAAEMSTYEAYRANLIDKRIYLFLSQQESEWQETTVIDSSGKPLHILTDQKSGRQFCIEKALSLNILQTSELQSYRSAQTSICELADLLISRKVVIKNKHSPIAGLWDVTFKKRLSIVKGFQHNLVDRLTALKLLEAQACTGGICDPSSGDRFQIADAVHHGLLDENFARPLHQYQQAFNGIIHPQTGKTLAKSVEEERKEHGDKVSKLLKWMSDVTSDVNKNGKAVSDDKGSTESSNKPQIPMEEALSKKEQITEAIRSTQQMLAKHSDKMSEKEKCEAKEQLKFLHQAHSELSEMCVNQTPSAEQEFEVIEGILDVGKGAVLSLVQRSIVHEETGLRLLAVKSGKDGSIAFSSGREISILKAMHEGLIDRETMLRLLSAQLFAGGIVDPRTNYTKAARKTSVSPESSENVQDQEQSALPQLAVVDFDLFNSSESTDMIQECPTSEFLPDVILSDDSNYTQHLAEQDEVPDAAKSEFPPVYLNELEQTAAKGAVNEIQRTERHALDNNECISSTTTQHDSVVTQVLVESKDPALLKNLSTHEGILPGYENQDSCPSDVNGHGQEPSSPVLMQSQLQEMLADKEPEMQKELLGLLGTTAQGDEGSFIEGVEVQAKAATSDGCEDDIFQSAWSGQQSSKANVATTEDVKEDKFRPRDLEKNLSGTRQNLEDTAFDVQNFISEHAQLLNPAQNRQMLKSLSATQRAFKELMERVFTQRHTLDLHLEIREDEFQQQNAVEKQKEFVAKLQELCDDLTQTENRLIGHQQQSNNAKSVGDLQQYQQENQVQVGTKFVTPGLSSLFYQALQKDIQANVNALNEVISSTKKFLEENRSKLTPEQVAAIELKLEEVKSKANMLNQRAEETRKELEKVVTTVINQEKEKVAAVEQLEETKNKIEVLLDWVSNIGKEKEMEGMAKENGNMPVEGKIKGMEDDPNGNALDATDNTSQWSGEDTKELDIDEQYERLKAHHQEILSQQQDLIIATQSAQALLDKQADVLSSSEKEKLQKDIHELRGRYEASLTQAERQMKQMQSVQEELRKFQGDYVEFGVWLQQAQEQLAELGAPTGHLAVLQEKLQKQKSFYEDVISHKGDLRFITISGQKVLDVAKACSRSECKEKQGSLDVDTSGTCAAVKEKLDSTATQYKVMHTQCNQLGNNLKDVVDKYKKYEDAASGLSSWLSSSEAEALQGQTTGHQVALETLRKAADALITAEGELLNNKDEIQESVDDLVERYDNLSKSVSDRNEKLQVTLTRSLSVQDGLDEMMNWMKKVEENVGEASKVPLDSAAIADALSKEAALEQDMSSRQSSISTMKAKVKKFVETAEPAAAAALQAKMEGLTQRFDNACEKHKQKISQMEQLKDKVEQFEKTSEKVQEFVLKHSHALYETDGPGKNVNELSQLVQDINAELAEHVKDMETLHLLAKELSNSGPEGSAALIEGKMANLSLTHLIPLRTRLKRSEEEEVLSCQDQLGEFKAAAGVLMKWLEETKEQVPMVQPNCSEQGLGNDVKKVNGLLEEWTAKAPAVQDINSKGSALCTLISVLTSPAKARMHHKSGSAVSNGSCPEGSYLTNNELMLVEQNMSSINEDYSSLGELLKNRSSDLSALLLKVQGVQHEAQSTLQWLENMKKTAASWNSESAGKDSMKMQIERQKAFEENMHQKQQQYQELRERLLHLIEESPDSPEAEKWKNMLKQMDAEWEEVKGSVENRKQHLEESSRMLELFQTNQPQLSQWLLEKDLMMSVLGPLSMDPNMLNTQKQQVQILLKEFEGRKPQYDQLNEAAMVISSASGNQDPTGEKVKKQLDDITQKWQALTSQLSERDALIQQAVGKTTQFQDILRQLGESAADLECQLNGQQTLSTQPDAVKKQLEATNAVLAKLCEEKKRLKEAESLCSELSALVTEEYLRANLTAQLESISKPFKMLEDKAGKRIQHLTSTFASSQEFHRTSKDFQGWIEQMLKEQAGPQSVSTKEETLLQSLREHSAIQSALSEQDEQYNNIMREAEALLQNTEGEEKLALQGQLSALRSNWEQVKRGAMEREEKLNVAMERARKYKEHAESLGTWLQESEDRKNKANFSVNPIEVENSLTQVKAIQRDVDKHCGQVELLNIAADSLLEVATEDLDDVKEEKIIIGQNMDKLIEGLQLKKETLEKLSQTLKEFSDTHKELSDQMDGARKQLEYHSSLGVQGYCNKNLTNMKAQQKNLEGVQNQIENLKSIAQSLIVDVPEVEGVVDLLLQADTLEKEHSSLSKAIEDTCNTMENKLQGIGQFQDSIREMFTTFADLDDELDSMGPVARDLKILQDQQGTIENFVKKLQDLMTNTANARDNCKKMLESQASSDLLGLKRDLEALSKQSSKLMDRAIGRKEQVEETLKQLQEFYHKLDTFTTQMAGAEEQEESQGPVGMETDFINQQLEAFKRSIYDTVRLNEQIDSGSKGSLASRHIIGTLPYSHRTLDMTTLCGNSVLASSSTFDLHSREVTRLDEQGEKKEPSQPRRSWKNFGAPNFSEYGTLCAYGPDRQALVRVGQGRSMTDSLTSEDDSGLCSPTTEQERRKQRALTRPGPGTRSLSSAEAVHVSGELKPGQSVSSGQEEFPFSPVRSLVPTTMYLTDSTRLEDQHCKEDTCTIDVSDKEHTISSDPYSELQSRMTAGSTNRVLNSTYNSHTRTLSGYDELPTAELSEDTSQEDCELLCVVVTQPEPVSHCRMTLEQHVTKDAECYENEQRATESKMADLEEFLLSVEREAALTNGMKQTMNYIGDEELENLITSLASCSQMDLMDMQSSQVFQKETIDSLQTQLQEVNCIGQGLIQNASKGTNTIALERDLEDVNMRWNTLNKKVAERSAQLHEALLQCGKFQDALESLFSWLKDTEELVASQKPPSAEFKVVKAQIQEQRLLQKLLDDRRPTVELIKKEGGKVLEMADSVDKEKIGKEIDILGKRWDALIKKAESRRKQLESILGVAQQFHETLEPLTEWLTATEKRLTSSEPIGTQTSKLEEQISQNKALEEEIIGHSKSLYQAISLGQDLRSLSCVDDKELIQAKLDSTQGSYIELQERCRMKAELLQRALANARLFGEDEVALMNWLDEIHGRLSHVSVQDYAPAILAKQHADQLALHEDIELRRQHVEQALQNGLELLKQTTGKAFFSHFTQSRLSKEYLFIYFITLVILSGDEVIIIQGKLDGIKTRYADISTMSNDVMKTLDKALSLANKVQHVHEELRIWLEKVESELATFGAQEPVGEQLTQVQERQKALLKEVQEHKSLVDTLNEVSSALLDLVPWRAREGLDKLITEDNERYRSASDAISQHVDQTGAAILKSQQLEQAADTELAWLTEAEKKLSSTGDIKLEVEKTTAQLQAQKGFSMDIMRHKDTVDDITKTGEALMNSKDETEKQALKAKIQALMEKYNTVSQLNSERCLQLERVHSLACQFWETYEELWPWLQETRANFTQLPSPAIEYETLRQQQEELRQLRELIAEHKPHIDKMNKTGPQLVEISPLEGEPIKEKFQVIDKLYAQLKADVKHRAAAIDEAISQSTQFHDKIDPMLESLNRIAERLRQPPSISVEVEKIREQISENKAVNMDLEKLQPSYETLKQRGEDMITRSEGADKDLSAKAVQDKLDQMVFVWNDIHALLEEREAKLLDVMDLAEKFWCDHCALIITIKDAQDLLKDLEEPGVDPSVVKQQQESVEGYREEIDGLQDELNVVQNLGAELMTACGEPDKPVIKKSIDEVNTAWETLNKTWKERVDRLEEAMQAAVQFQDGLQGMFDWVDILESKLDSMSPVGTDLETVKQQIEELKEFKGEAYQLQIEMERLNHQAGLLLKKVLEEADRSAIQEPMNELKMLWDNLDEKVINRQHKLEGALLALGQFQHALDELLAWLTHTEELLSGQKKTSGEPKAIEIELAKHHVLHNDVMAHKTTVEAVNKAGRDLIESSAGEEACGLQSKLENLNQRWTSILEKTEQRRHLLDSALLQAQGFHGEIEDMQQWLKDTECQLLASKAVGGLPDTAREQLNTHLELCKAMEVKEELYQKLLLRGQQLKAMTPENPDSGTEQDLRNLQEKWECVQSKVAERKVKLEEALAMATDFHNSLQDFINWLTQAEQTLNIVSPASLILETILFQIDEHKIFATEVNSHRDQIIELDKTGTHLKYFSQKQDVVLIKNLLLSVQSRWDKVVQRSVERGRLLDDARKRAKQFHESWSKLMEWLEESERALDSELEIANDPDKIKMQLAQHKDFQKALGAKHSVYDTTSRTGRALKDKTSLQDDNQKLHDMLCELRDKWDTICGKSVERQNKLEEALLFSGQFTDALQALIDWLYKIEPQLAEDQPVHGDIDLVLNLIDSHKVFQKELGKRTGSVQALKRSARELVENSHDDSSWVKVQMQELSLRWETVCTLSVQKQTRLEQALCQAQEFHSTVHILLEWLAEAEQSLRFHGSLPEDEDALRVLIEQHKANMLQNDHFLWSFFISSSYSVEFIKKLEEKSVALSKAISMGEAILAICHPDSITTVKHWNTIIKARFEEVTAWARQHQQRLSSALSELMATQELLENLLSWLQWAETTLTEKDKEALPQEIEEIKALITEHQTFMEEMTRKQPDVDKVTKTHKRKSTSSDAPVQSQIPVLEKGRTGRKRSQAQSMYPATVQAPIETKNPRVNLLVSKWQQVWLLALDRRRKLNDALDRLEELKEFANFDFDVWRKRYMRWMNHKKSRVMDFFRRMDKDQDGKVTRQEFIDGILSSKFPTSRLEMSAVADIFDRDGDGYIDYYEFVAALHPNKDAYKPLTDADKIEDEVTRQVAKCKCPKRFQVEQIGANKYRFYLGNQFGDSQQLRLVRILRSTVMVRVGGGWMALDEFLVKNDPCRAKGRTNVELREKFILPEGTTQVMASFRYRGRRSRPSSRGASPNRSNSSHSCPAQPNTAVPGTPKSTPIQGSKLRLPGYLSGKGFQSGEEGTLINAAILKARSQAAGYSKIPSRPGSKAGSRGSSRRGSDASDFDISDIQSVCSDVSETVMDSARPRSSPRQPGVKPSKIPTPQRRSMASSKLAKTTTKR